jgi:hypothetical protein
LTGPLDGVDNLEDTPIVRPHKQHVEQLTVSCFHLGVHGNLPVLAGMPENSAFSLVTGSCASLEDTDHAQWDRFFSIGRMATKAMTTRSSWQLGHAQWGPNLEI